ncbi:TIGR04222 domain-containing membrane protein, partial [Coleofasciculus sp. LEGE 07081]
MNVQQAELYRRIQAFSLDEPDTNQPFTQRLARENRWSARYTQRVTDEYKKFVFLAAAAGHPVAPSDQVDQVWHLHLLYTHSYWGEFCPNILQMPFHHSPSRGGKSEHHKFYDWYSKTLASYESFFGHAPPADIWTPAHIRFAGNVDFVRVNAQQTWLLPKPHLRTLPKLHLDQRVSAILLFVLVVTITGCEPLLSTGIRNPLNFTGSEFLRFYLLVASAVFLVAYCLRWYLRQPAANFSSSTVSLDTYETAYLVGGKNKVIETAIASLVQRGHLKPQPTTRSLILEKPLPADSHPLERAIAKVIKTDGRIERVKASVSTTINQICDRQICDRLQHLHLLVSKNQAKVAQQLPAMAVFAVLLLGISKIGVGISRGKPVGFLFMLCLFTAIVGLGFLYIPVFRSRYGDRVLADIQNRHAHLKQTSTSSTSTDPQLVLAFALFGTGVLAGSSLNDLRQVLTPPPSSSGGDSGGG